MKNVIRILCLALCLCMLPVLSLAASDTMTAYDASGVTYYIWNDWGEPVVQDQYIYYYKNVNNPLDGFVMSMQMSDPSIPTSEEGIASGLQEVITGMEEMLGSPVTSEPLVIDDRQGLYFYGAMTGVFGMSGYVTLINQTVVAVVVASGTTEETAIRPLLMEVLAIPAEE